MRMLYCFHKKVMLILRDLIINFPEQLNGINVPFFAKLPGFDEHSKHIRVQENMSKFYVAGLPLSWPEKFVIQSFYFFYKNSGIG